MLVKGRTTWFTGGANIDGDMCDRDDHVLSSAEVFGVHFQCIE